MAVLIDTERNKIIFERPGLEKNEIERKNAAYEKTILNRIWTDDPDVINNLVRAFYYLADFRGQTLEIAHISKNEAERRQRSETRGNWRLSERCPVMADHHLYMTCNTCGQKD